MKISSRRALALGMVMVWLAGIPLMAHDLELQVATAAPAVIVRATYAGSDPVSHAAIEVYSPLKPEEPFQKGHTDANGAFSFVPDYAGAWRIVVDDGMGHLADQHATVHEAVLDGEVQPSQTASSTPQKLVTGIGFIVGATGLLLWVRARQILKQSGKA